MPNAGVQPPEDGAWYAVWTHSHCEHQVRQQLAARGFHSFLPEVQTWSKRLGSMHLIRTPMFPGYLFVRDTMDKQRYLTALQEVPDVVVAHGKVTAILKENPARETLH